MVGLVRFKISGIEVNWILKNKNMKLWNILTTENIGTHDPWDHLKMTNYHQQQHDFSKL